MNKITEKFLTYNIGKKSKRFDILRTFELFNKENMSILRDKIVEIILVEADNIFSKNKKIFDIDFKKDKSMQIAVFNDKQTYDLLSNTWKRHKMKSGNLNDKSDKSGIFD
ncbi:MAG TPA: hypothetical protein P5556_06570 [Candidatus Gastranaerophilales bacterium]|nr:hypothetical protein [Candidatus Gastranaerophilales bacterium]